MPRRLVATEMPLPAECIPIAGLYSAFVTPDPLGSRERVTSEEWVGSYHEALEGAVVGLQQDAGHGAHLGSAVPAVGAVDQHTGALLRDGLRTRPGQPR